MKRILRLGFATMATLLIALPAFAVPVLQVGAPGGPGEGTYADYSLVLTNPLETFTAITAGSTIYVGGIRESNVSLGGKGSYGTKDWSDFKLPADFDNHGAILLVSVPDGSRASALASLKVDGLGAFYSSQTKSYFPNFHAPLKPNIADFLFFDIEFFSDTETVPNFVDEMGRFPGEVKELTISGMEGLPWIHFDVMALQTVAKKEKRSWVYSTTLECNPGSHDVTWKQVPEPSTLLLLGAGLVGFGIWGRRKFRS